MLSAGNKLCFSYFVLEQLFQELNLRHFQGELPLLKLTWNPRLRSTAGRFGPGSRNPLRPRAPLIEIAAYLEKIPEGEYHVKDTLLHEMIHYYLWFKKKPYGHTSEFHAIMKRVGARRYNPVPKLSPIKHWYECPKCLIRVPARRKLGPSACAVCCKKFNRGEFSALYVLRKINGSSEKVEPAKSLPPNEIIRRLEALKQMIQKKLTWFLRLAFLFLASGNYFFAFAFAGAFLAAFGALATGAAAFASLGAFTLAAFAALPSTVAPAKVAFTCLR